MMSANPAVLTLLIGLQMLIGYIIYVVVTTKRPGGSPRVMGGGRE